jgi:hypothetical protein
VLVEEGLVGLMLYMTMMLSVFYYVLHLPSLERRFGLVLLMTLVTAMLPLTWEHEKVAWVVMAALVGISSMQVGGPSGAARQPLLRRAVPVGRPPVAARP